MLITVALFTIINYNHKTFIVQATGVLFATDTTPLINCKLWRKSFMLLIKLPFHNGSRQGILIDGKGWVQLTSSLRLLVLVKKVNNIFIIKRSWSKLVSTRRSTVLSLSRQKDFPGPDNEAIYGCYTSNLIQGKFYKTFFSKS